jgi:hypothetical protein
MLYDPGTIASWIFTDYKYKEETSVWCGRLREETRELAYLDLCCIVFFFIELPTR